MKVGQETTSKEIPKSEGEQSYEGKDTKGERICGRTEECKGSHQVEVMKDKRNRVRRTSERISVYNSRMYNQL